MILCSVYSALCMFDCCGCGGVGFTLRFVRFLSLFCIMVCVLVFFPCFGSGFCGFCSEQVVF